jgi:hypothetical protein
MTLYRLAKPRFGDLLGSYARQLVPERGANRAAKAAAETGVIRYIRSPSGLPDSWPRAGDRDCYRQALR